MIIRECEKFPYNINNDNLIISESVNINPKNFVIKNKSNIYFVDYDDIESLSENYDLSIEDSYSLILHENNISSDNSVVSIYDYKLLEDPHCIDGIDNIVLKEESVFSEASLFIDSIIDECIETEDLSLIDNYILNDAFVYKDEFKKNKKRLNDIGIKGAHSAREDTLRKQSEYLNKLYSKRLKFLTNKYSNSKVDSTKVKELIKKDKTMQNIIKRQKINKSKLKQHFIRKDKAIERLANYKSKQPGFILVGGVEDKAKENYINSKNPKKPETSLVKSGGAFLSTNKDNEIKQPAGLPAIISKKSTDLVVSRKKNDNENLPVLSSNSRPKKKPTKVELTPNPDYKEDKQTRLSKYAKIGIGVAGTASALMGMKLTKDIVKDYRNRPKTWLAKKISALRHSYSRVMKEAERNPRKAGFLKRLASKILIVIDKLMSRLQNISN